MVPAYHGELPIAFLRRYEKVKVQYHRNHASSTLVFAFTILLSCATGLSGQTLPEFHSHDVYPFDNNLTFLQPLDYNDDP